MTGLLLFLLMILTAMVTAYSVARQEYLLLAWVPILLAISALLHRRINREEDENYELESFETLKGVELPLGELAVEQGMIGRGELLKILRKNKKTGREFGEVAVEMGFLTSDQIESLLLAQKERSKRDYMDGVKISDVSGD